MNAPAPATGRPLTIHLANEEATRRLGEDLAAALKPGDLLTLSGDLGAGKSTLARALLRAFYDDEALDVPSPTFTLVQHYAGRMGIAHVDLYRIGEESEIDELAIDEALEEGAVLLEWPERADRSLPSERIALHLETDGESRRATIETGPVAGTRIERSLAIRTLLDRHGMEGASRRFLAGDASARAYESLHAGERSALIMNAPATLAASPLDGGESYIRRARLAGNVGAFVGIDRMLRGAGFGAPHIRHADLDGGFLVIEDLGRQTIRDPKTGVPIPERYECAARLLAAIHRTDWPHEIAIGDGRTHHVPPFDRQVVETELDLLPQWYLPHIAETTGAAATSEDWTARYQNAWRAVTPLMEDAETSLLLRDYHSPNLLWQPEREGIDRIGLIDFQDALIGPSAYDLASLAMDARVAIDEALEKRVRASYYEARRQWDAHFDVERFEASYALMAAQRNSKIIGLFVRLSRRDGKHGYLDHLPHIAAYIRRALRHEALAPLRPPYAEIGLWHP